MCIVMYCPWLQTILSNMYCARFGSIVQAVKRYHSCSIWWPLVITLVV